ncbi:MAG TPA: hypothetical protein VKI01_09845 [Acidimicrobiia bacterium]|nr:hypothetical protein [Acidimicrobiia bacterium]
MTQAGRRRRGRGWWRFGLLTALLVAAACVPVKAPPPPPPASPLVQAACESRIQSSTAGQVASNDLIETSGVAASRRNAGVLWAHNDSGDSARVFAMTTSGGHLGWFTLAGASATDWEDMALGPGPQAGQSYLYLGDIGDNNSVRTSVVVYRVPEPTVDISQPPGDNQVLGGVDALVLQYPDGAHDAEALAVDPVNGDIVIVTKNLSGEAGVYVLRASSPTSTLTRTGTLELGFATLVTGASVAPDGTAVALRTYGSVLLYPRADGTPLDDAFRSSPCTGASVSEPQGEAIAVTADGRGYVTISEGSHPPVNRFDIT